MLQAFSDLIRFQMGFFTSAPSATIAGVVLLDFLAAYVVFSVAAERKIHRVEQWLIPALMIIIVWVSLQLMEKSLWLGNMPLQ